jgi:ABC-type polysaccharide/polyol phosphate export permease
MRETVILASAVPHIYKLLIELGVCIVIAMWTKMLTISDIFFLIPLSVSFIMMTLGVGIVVMVGFNILRDVAHAWGLIARLLFFLTPVFYSLSDINPRVATLQYWVNPLTPFICAFRDIFLVDGKFLGGVYAHCLFQGPLFLGLAYIIFLTLERKIDECV